MSKLLEIRGLRISCETQLVCHSHVRTEKQLFVRLSRGRSKLPAQ